MTINFDTAFDIKFNVSLCYNFNLILIICMFTNDSNMCKCFIIYIYKLHSTLYILLTLVVPLRRLLCAAETP